MTSISWNVISWNIMNISDSEDFSWYRCFRPWRASCSYKDRAASEVIITMRTSIRTMRGPLARQAGGLPSVWRTLASRWENLANSWKNSLAKGSRDWTISKLCTTSSCSLSELDMTIYDNDMTTSSLQICLGYLCNSLGRGNTKATINAQSSLRWDQYVYRQHALTCFFVSLTREPEPPQMHGQKCNIIKPCIEVMNNEYSTE